MKMLYRNTSGALEFKENTDIVKSYQVWDRENPEGIQLKEFTAADAQLGLLRIADPVQTALVQGYVLPQTIGDKLFTPVRMAKETGRFPAFGKEAMYIPANLKRSLGEKVQRAQTQNGYVLMALSEYAEGIGIENREFNEWAGTRDQLLTSKLNVVNGRIARLREKLQAVLLTTYTNYASGLYSSGANFKWGGATPTGDPIADFLDLINLVRKSAGQRPNKGWATPTAWRKIRTNPAVLNLLKYGGTAAQPAQVTTNAIAQLLELDEFLVGYATYATDTSTTITDGAPQKGTPVDGYIWEATNASAAGVCVVGTGGGIEPAFGYTWERANSPVIESYYDNTTKSQVWDYEHFFDPAITLNTAGAMYYSIA
jgi:hypothetical protein